MVMLISALISHNVAMGNSIPNYYHFMDMR